MILFADGTRAAPGKGLPARSPRQNSPPLHQPYRLRCAVHAISRRVGTGFRRSQTGQKCTVRPSVCGRNSQNGQKQPFRGDGRHASHPFRRFPGTGLCSGRFPLGQSIPIHDRADIPLTANMADCGDGANPLGGFPFPHRPFAPEPAKIAQNGLPGGGNDRSRPFHQFTGQGGQRRQPDAGWIHEQVRMNFQSSSPRRCGILSARRERF